MEHQRCLPIQVFNVTFVVMKLIPHLLGLWIVDALFFIYF
jgi:hypothetical protein